jgi:hypothetical protein
MYKEGGFFSLKVNQHKSMQQQQNPVNAPILTYTV